MNMAARSHPVESDAVHTCSINECDASSSNALGCRMVLSLNTTAPCRVHLQLFSLSWRHFAATPFPRSGAYRTGPTGGGRGKQDALTGAPVSPRRCDSSSFCGCRLKSTSAPHALRYSSSSELRGGAFFECASPTSQLPMCHSDGCEQQLLHYNSSMVAHFFIALYPSLLAL
jgi:hypothetical protein